MTIVPYVARILFCVALVSLTACGGGGGSDNKSPAPAPVPVTPTADTTPNAITFTATTNAKPGDVVTSPAVAITGIDAAAAISITGGQYSINGGAFTAAAGTVTVGQTVAVKVTASTLNSTAVEAVVTVGGVSGTFRVTTVADTTPDAFTFAPAINAALSSEHTSNPITVAGIAAESAITIVGGQYSINGAAFTAAAGTVTNGQTVAVKVTASSLHSVAVESVLTIGGVNGAFRVTTLADTTPNAFTFTAVSDADLASEKISNAITVAGIDAETVISIVGGEYSINGAAYTAAAGKVTNGQTVTVKSISANKNEVTTETVLTIGGVSSAFNITTKPDTEAPVAEFIFPTPYTMSEANTVTVRGSAMDSNTITRVQLKVNDSDTLIDVETKVDGDYSSWTADVPLTANSENTIAVMAEDNKGNFTQASEADSVVIRQAPAATAFPNANNPFRSIWSGLALDNYNGNNRILLHDSGRDRIYAVDIATGAPTQLFPTRINNAWGLTIDAVNNRLFFINEGELVEMNLTDGAVLNSYNTSLLDYPEAMVFDSEVEQFVIADYNSTQGANLVAFSLAKREFSLLSSVVGNPLLHQAEGIVVDAPRNRYLVSVGGQYSDISKHAIVAIDRTTGTHSVFSSNTITSGDPFSALLDDGNQAGLFGLAIDEEKNRLLVNEVYSGKVFDIDLITGNRKILVGLYYANETGFSATLSQGNIKIDKKNRYAFIIESNRSAVLIIDLETGEKVILSKRENDF